jgi:putative flippase GtrA
MQFLLYLIVGGLSFLLDIGVFIGLRRLNAAVIPASVASFLVATAGNYVLSVLLAFRPARFARHIEMLRFLAVVAVGLGLNTALVWLFVYSLGIPPTAAKIAAVPLVLAWNYLGRRTLVFDHRIPQPIENRIATARGVVRAGSARFLPTGKRARRAAAVD